MPGALGSDNVLEWLGLDLLLGGSLQEMGDLFYILLMTMNFSTFGDLNTMPICPLSL